jgi:membrane associated rhomboid family serine protease
MASYYASTRMNIGAMYAYGLNLVQNGGRSPFTLLSSVSAFASNLR